MEIGSEVHIDMFDDRIEIYSPGGMVSGISLEGKDLLKIPSKRRNPILADIFSRLKYMERRGSGFKKILADYKGQIEFDETKMPVFEADNDDFILTLYNLNYGSSYATQANENVIENVIEISEEKIKKLMPEYSRKKLAKACEILKMISENPNISIDELRIALDVTDRTIARYISELTLTNYDADAMVTEICRSYIVNVHLCFETFLKDVCQQINKCGKNEYKPRIQEESYLACAVRNICGNSISDDMKPLYELCEYYRLIRNSSVHDLCEIDSHEKEYRKLQKYNFKTDAKFSKLVAPNIYEEISFDDFVMFSRSCVELATYIFEKMEYDYAKIVKDIPHKQVSKWQKYSKKRQKRALYSYINTLYQADETLIEQIPELINIFLCNILASTI